MSESPLKPFSRFLSDGLLSGLVGTPNKSQIPLTSRPFALLVQNVNSASSKHEEEQVVKRELQTIKEDISQVAMDSAQLRDYICRVMYCHMLGYDVKWSYVSALNLACGNCLIGNRIGYLATCLMLNRESEIVLLLTSSMTKNIASSNILENIAGLNAASQLLKKEHIPFMLDYVLQKLRHPRELVRQKAVMCLHQFLLLAPDLLEQNLEDLHKVIYDKDPSVMAAAVHIVQYLISKNPENYESIGSSLLDILKQIINRKMSSSFEYHSIQLPWLQIRVLRCLSTLVIYQERLKEDLCLFMKELLQRLNLKEQMGFAILYECICCIITMKPDGLLLDQAAQHVGRLLRSSDPNLKYMGVKALTQLVQTDAQYAMNYQSLIVDSLESEEINIQKKMYKLLYQIANKTNVEAVCSKLLTHFTMTTDKYWRSEVITMVIDLAESLPTSADWQIQTVLSCIQQGGDLVDSVMVDRIIDLLHTGYVLKTDVKGQQILVQKCVTCMLMKNTTPALIHIAAWILGELCILLQKMAEDKVISLFTKHLCDQELPFSVKSTIISALQKLLVNKVVSSVTMVTKLENCLENQHLVIIQRLSLLIEVCEAGLVLERSDATTVDTTLSFLDDFVSQCLESGGTPYIPVHLRKQSPVSEPEDASLFQGTSTPNRAESIDSRGRSHSKTSSNKTEDDEDATVKFGAIKRVWGRQGRINEELQEVGASIKDSPFPSRSREKEELATMLFSGIQSPNSPYRDDFSQDVEDEQGFMTEVSDDAGWRTAFSSLSLQSNKQTDSHTLLSPTLTDIETPREHESNSEVRSEINTDILDFDVKSDSKQGCDSLHLNSTALDSNSNTNSIIDPQIADFTDSLASSNNIFNDTASTRPDDNSSFLNISVSSTDQSQVNFTHTRNVADRAAFKTHPENEIMDSCQIVTVPSDMSSEQQTDSDVQSEGHQSIYTEVVSLYDDYEDDDGS